jgi:hypothetical protein
MGITSFVPGRLINKMTDTSNIPYTICFVNTLFLLLINF